MPASGEDRLPRTARLLRRPRLLGAVLAALLFVQSLQPSLLVRDWPFQGVVSGVALTAGYVVGAGLTWCARELLHQLGRAPQPWSPVVDLRVRVALGAALVAVGAWTSAVAVREHRWTWARLDHEPASAWLVYGGTLLVAVLVSAALLVLAWPWRWARRRMTGLGGRLVPRWLAAGLATVLVLWAALTTLNTWV